MGSILQESKLTLRREMRARLAALSEEYRKTASEQAGALLGKQPVWQHAKSVLCYAPLDHELNVWPMVGSARQA
jgi:5-formyltetrahydrofolate cyclo-ligase